MFERPSLFKLAGKVDFKKFIIFCFSYGSYPQILSYKKITKSQDMAKLYPHTNFDEIFPHVYAVEH